MPRLLALVFACLVGATACVAQPSSPGAPSEHSSASRSSASSSASATPSAMASVEDAPIYYVVRERPHVFAKPDSAVTLSRLDFRQDVRVIEQRPDGWSRVLGDDTIGWVASSALSNVWLLVEKESRNLYVYRGAELVRRLPADVSQNPTGDKVRRAALGERDHYRIPEGEFFICQKNLNSQYYRALMLNYPNAEDAERGLEAGIISRAEYAEIVKASLGFRSPPMGTALGGAIAIHGQGSGRQRAWTRGCVALRDVHIDAIWDLVEVGTPVLIR